MKSHIHSVHLTHEVSTRHGRRYFGILAGENQADLSQKIKLCHILPAEYADEQDILYVEVHRVDIDPDESTDKERRMKSQLTEGKILEVRIASQDVGEENFEDRQWFRWFIYLLK